MHPIEAPSLWRPSPSLITSARQFVPSLPLPFELPADWGSGIERSPLLRLQAIAAATEIPPQFGLMARCAGGGGLGVNLNEGIAAGFFGVNGSGKSYALMSLLEMMVQFFGAIGPLKAPHCGVWMHYHPSADYEPEVLDSIFPNLIPSEARELVHDWRVLPAGLRDVVLLTVPDRVEAARRRHPFVEVAPIVFPLRELGVQGLSLLVGLTATERPLYARQLEALLRRLLRETPAPTLADLLQAVKDQPLDPVVRERVGARLALLGPWIDDSRSLRGHLRAGRLIIVDIRDAWLQRLSAMDLFALVMGAMVLNAEGRNGFPVTVAMDEAHKFVACPIVREMLAVLVRERRHLRAGVLLASQDPLSVPPELISLLDLIGVFRHGSAVWSRHLGRQIEALAQLVPSLTGELPGGVAWLWAKQWHLVDDGFGPLGDRPILGRLRPRVTRHGGATQRAVP